MVAQKVVKTAHLFDGSKAQHVACAYLLCDIFTYQVITKSVNGSWLMAQRPAAHGSCPKAHGSGPSHYEAKNRAKWSAIAK